MLSIPLLCTIYFVFIFPPPGGRRAERGRLRRWGWSATSPERERPRHRRRRPPQQNATTLSRCSTTPPLPFSEFLSLYLTRVWFGSSTWTEKSSTHIHSFTVYWCCSLCVCFTFLPSPSSPVLNTVSLRGGPIGGMDLKVLRIFSDRPTHLFLLLLRFGYYYCMLRFGWR